MTAGDERGRPAPVFKTGERRSASLAGSIPVRLRYLRKRRHRGQLGERTVVAPALVAAFLGCVCRIIRASSATELAASSSGLTQADDDIPDLLIGRPVLRSHGPS